MVQEMSEKSTHNKSVAYINTCTGKITETNSHDLNNKYLLN